MNDLHKQWIEKLAAMVDPQWVAQCRATVKKAFAFEPVDELPYLNPAVNDEPRWPTYDYNDAFDDPEKMLFNQLAGVYDAARTRDYRPLNIRPHFGTVILAAMMGGPWQLTDNSLPWAHHLEGGRDAIRALIDRGPADPRHDLGGRCLETAAYYRQTLAQFPPLDRCVDIYHPDLQGPYDVAHLLMGPDIFIAGYDEPELVERLVDVVTQSYRNFILAWQQEVGFNDDDGMTTHWSFFIRGKLMLRNDTTILLRPEHYDRFVRPFDQRLLTEFGGTIHLCGKWDHLYESLMDTGGLTGVHCSQPSLNDHARLLRLAQERKMMLLSWPEKMLPPDVTTGVLVGQQNRRAK